MLVISYLENLIDVVLLLRKFILKKQYKVFTKMDYSNKSLL